MTRIYGFPATNTVSKWRGVRVIGLLTIFFFLLSSCQSLSSYSQYHSIVQDKSDYSQPDLGVQSDLRNQSSSGSVSHDAIPASDLIPAFNNSGILLSDTEYELQYTPGLEPFSRIVSEIQASNDSIEMSMYLLTAQDVVDALISAKKRGVFVRVLLEKNVYTLPKINHSAYEQLRAEGVNVAWSSESDMNFNHSKYAIFDGKSAFIATGNLSASTFTNNRDIFLFTRYPGVISDLKHVFDKDFVEAPMDFSVPLLAISPSNSSMKLYEFVRTAQKSIIVFAPSLEDRGLIEELSKKSKQGVDITLCLSLDSQIAFKTTANELNFQNYTLYGSKKPFTHAKTILRDDSALWIGSMNFTSNSLNNNREVGIELTIGKNLLYYKKIFQQDCKP